MPRETKTLLKLVEQNETIATELPPTFAELVREDAVGTDQVTEATTAALTQVVESGNSPQRITEGFADLLAMCPELPASVIEPLSRMALHEDSDMRREAIRCLGFVGAYDSAERDLAAERVTDALTDEQMVVQQAALWSLTKLGLADPDVLTLRRDQLGEFLGIRPPQSCHEPEEVSALRRFAVEALAINALGSIDIDDQYPRDDSLENEEAVAGWAIQRSVAECGLPVNCDRQLAQTTSIRDDHSIAPHVASALAQMIESDDRKVATGAVIALGYLVPWQSDLQDYIELLNEVIDQPQDQERAEAAQYVLTHGPIMPTYPAITNPSSDTEFELQATPVDNPCDNLRKWSEIGVPYDVEDELFVTDAYDGFQGTVELEGRNSAQARIGVVYCEDDNLTLTDQLRRVLGVEYGDTVTVRATATVPARKVVVSLPVNAPVTPKYMTSVPVREELSRQRYTVGEQLSINVVTDREQLLDECERANSWHSISDEIKHDCTQRLPVRVESILPETANRITKNTEIVVERTADIDCDLWANVDATEDESVTPLSVFREDIKPQMGPDPSTMEMIMEDA